MRQLSTKWSKPVLWIVLITMVLLSIPLIAMQFTSEVNWNALDFVVAGSLIMITGFCVVLVARKTPSISMKYAFGYAIGITFLMVWANLAVGLIGAGPHWGNLMYLGVIAVGLFGTVVSRFSPLGMERTMYAVAFSFALITVIAFVIGMEQYPGSSLNEIIAVNGSFALAYVFGGILFRFQRTRNV